MTRTLLTPTQVKAALTANGYPTTEGEFLHPADITQFRLLAFFLGHDMDTAEQGLAYPGLLPEAFYDLVAGSGEGTDPEVPEEPDTEEPEETDPEPEPEAPVDPETIDPGPTSDTGSEEPVDGEPDTTE